VEDPVQPTQQASESSEADFTQDSVDERIVPEVEGKTEDSAQAMEEGEALDEEEAEVPETGEDPEVGEDLEAEEEETDESAFEEEELPPEEELAPFEEIDFFKEERDDAEFRKYFEPNYDEIAQALQNPTEPQEIDPQPFEDSPPIKEEEMPILDTLEASNQATEWIAQAKEDEAPSIQIDPSLLRS
jgi:hypothetical protein